MWVWRLRGVAQSPGLERLRPHGCWCDAGTDLGAAPDLGVVPAVADRPEMRARQAPGGNWIGFASSGLAR